jgi:5,6,7,8-tetrahydromethanopterin hydro-lyase
MIMTDTDYKSKFNRVLYAEVLVGERPEVAHIDLVMGPRGSSVEAAFVNALASPQRGHTPLLAIVAPNLPAKPATLMVNKVTMKRAKQALRMFGPAQHAVGMAVMDCVADGTIPKDLADDLFIIVSVFISWDARDRQNIHDWNYEAVKLAIKRAVNGEPSVDEILAKKDTAVHPFY